MSKDQGKVVKSGLNTGLSPKNSVTLYCVPSIGIIFFHRARPKFNFHTFFIKYPQKL